MLGDPVRERVEGASRFVEFDLRDGLNLLVFEVDDQGAVVEYFVQRD